MATTPAVSFRGPYSMSPSGDFLALAEGRQLKVHSLPESQVLRTHTCPQPGPAEVCWSADSKFYLAAIHSQGTIFVWSITNPAWSARISEHEFMPTAHASFSPDNTHVLLFSDLQLRLSVWPLASESGEPSLLFFPKHASPRCFSFTQDATFCALLQRMPSHQPLPAQQPAHQLRPAIQQQQQQLRGAGGQKSSRAPAGQRPNKQPMRVQEKNVQRGAQQQAVQLGRDMLVIYDTSKWQAVNSFHLPTEDACDVLWAPDCTCLAVWDHPLTLRLLLVSPSGQPLLHLEPPGVGLGLRLASFLPSAAALAVGALADGRISLLHALPGTLAAGGAAACEVEATGAMLEPGRGGRPVALFETWVHLEGVACLLLCAGAWSVFCFQECEDQSMLPTGEPVVLRSFSLSLVGGASHDVPLPLLNAGRGKAAAGKHGIGLLAWSSDGLFLAARNDAVPTILWLFCGTRRGQLRLFSVVCLLGGVRAAAWHPSLPLLAVCSGGPCVHLWRHTPAAALGDSSNSSSAGAVACECVEEGQGSLEEGVVDLQWRGESMSLLLKHPGGASCLDLHSFETGSDEQ